MGNDNNVKGEKIQELVEIAQLSNDKEKKDKAVEEILYIFIPLRKFIAKKYANNRVYFDDILQHINLKIVEAIYDYDKTKDSSAMRHIISRARNGAWNYYKKEMKNFNTDRYESSLDSFTIRLDTSNESIEINVMDKIGNNDNTYDEDYMVQKIILKDEINKIPKKQREIIELHYFRDMTQEDIAEYLDINQSSVSKAKKRGIASLKSKLIPASEHYDKQ